MHIMEGFLPAKHCVGWGVASAPFVAYGLSGINKRIKENPEQRMLLGVATAFTFVLSALRLAIGTNGSSREQVRELPVSGGAPQVSVSEKKGGQVSMDASPRSVYERALRAAIERCKDYPLMARRQRLEGIVKVFCLISRDGELKESRVESTSGISILDNAALRTVRSGGW